MIPRLRFKLTALVALALLLAACAGAPDLEAMLLAPEDFPDLQLRVERTGSVDLEGGERSAETVLLGEGYKVYHSVVILQDTRRAQEMMEALKGNPDSLGAKVTEAPALGQDVLGVIRDRSGRNRRFIIFREDNLLVRVTLEGEGPAEDLVLFAQRAWEKAR